MKQEVLGLVSVPQQEPLPIQGKASYLEVQEERSPSQPVYKLQRQHRQQEPALGNNGAKNEVLKAFKTAVTHLCWKVD